MPLTIEPASDGDIAAVLSLLDEPAAYLQEIGVKEQWPAKISHDTTWTALVQKLVGLRQVFLARQDGETVGVFHLRESPELGDTKDLSWDGIAGPALYLYTLAVSRRVAGRDVAKAMLDWACYRAAGLGRALRLDCWAGNARLRRYYREAGFKELGDVEVRSSLDGRAYFVTRFERICASGGDS